MNFQDVIRSVQRLPRTAWVAGALPVVWLAFGSTFVALKVGVATVPPFLFSGARFVMVGGILLTWSAWRAGWRIQVDRREALLAAGTGVAMILAGQGAASWSSQYLAPGVVGVLTSTMPLWAGLIGWLAFGIRISALGAFGVVAGFAGVAFLAWPRGGAGIEVGLALLVVAGAASWAAAVVVASRSGILRRPVLITSVQMLVGGGLQIVVALVTGEAAQMVPHQLVLAIPAFVYLVAVPSLIGFPLFNWLLSEVPVHVANTAAYVAPVVALALGWLLLAEQVTPPTLGGVAVILVGVALIVWSASRTRPGAEAEPEPPVELMDASQRYRAPEMAA